MPPLDGNPANAQIQEIVSLQGIRNQARKVLKAARNQDLTNFTFDESLMPQVEDLVAGIIAVRSKLLSLQVSTASMLMQFQRDYSPDKYDDIPSHSRLHHFSAGGKDRVQTLVDQWHQQGCDSREVARRVIDLLFVSVLLDAGAGDVWKYDEPGTQSTYPRSEGIAVASIRMFVDGGFQSRNEVTHSVDGTLVP